VSKIRQIVSGLAISLSLTAPCIGHGGSHPKLESAPRIRIQGVPNATDKRLLQQATLKFVSYLAGSFVLPKEIYMANGPGGPSFKDDMVTLRYPYYEQSEKKSALESISINLHEVSHYVFEKTIHALYVQSPEVLWAFFTRIDDLGSLESLELISKTKSQTKYKNLSDEKIQEIFAEYQLIGSVYNELLADAMVAFYMRDADTIFKNLYFENLARSEDPTDRAFQASHQLRRFDEPHSMSTAREALRTGSDPYAVLAPARQTLWRTVFVDYQSRHPEISGGEILLKVMRTVVGSFIDSTKSFSLDPKSLTADQLNDDLTHSIKTNFLK